MTSGVTTLRPASPGDLPAIAAIYAVEVLEGTASFEIEPPDEAEMARRLADVLGRGLPWLVAELDGEIAGYAYAGPYRTRAAYAATVENSVYVARSCRGHGIGRMLLDALIEACAAAGRREMVAIIGDSANAASIRLHEACGFRLVGTLQGVGRKHGRWIDTVLMQRSLRSR